MVGGISLIWAIPNKMLRRLQTFYLWRVEEQVCQRPRVKPSEVGLNGLYFEFFGGV